MQRKLNRHGHWQKYCSHPLVVAKKEKKINTNNVADNVRGWTDVLRDGMFPRGYGGGNFVSGLFAPPAGSRSVRWSLFWDYSTPAAFHAVSLRVFALYENVVFKFRCLLAIVNKSSLTLCYKKRPLQVLVTIAGCFCFESNGRRTVYVNFLGKEFFWIQGWLFYC